jgi:hypothetical protein
MVGAWNLAILNPKWFANEIMNVPKGTKFEIEMGVGPTMQLRAKIEGLIFIPSADRVIIAPAEENVDLIKFADSSALKLHTILPYTPIDGIGYNFTYELEENESFAGAVDFSTEYNKEAYKKFNGSAASTSTMLHSVKIADEPSVVLNLTYRIVEGQLSLIMNYHYSIGFDKEKVKDALGKFYRCYEHSKLVSSVLIAEEVN